MSICSLTIVLLTFPPHARTYTHVFDTKFKIQKSVKCWIGTAAVSYSSWIFFDWVRAATMKRVLSLTCKLQGSYIKKEYVPMDIQWLWASAFKPSSKHLGNFQDVGGPYNRKVPKFVQNNWEETKTRDSWYTLCIRCPWDALTFAEYNFFVPLID